MTGTVCDWITLIELVGRTTFEVLKELDPSGVAPTGHAGGLQPVMREDVAQGSLDSEDVLKNAPRREGQFFRVNAVLEE